MTVCHRLVIKLGTNLITAGKDSLDRRMMARLVDQVAELHRRGREVIIVSSGTVAPIGLRGFSVMNMETRWRTATGSYIICEICG